MKKVISVFIACLLCFCMGGCMSEEEKFLKAQDEWFANLSYDTFELYSTYDFSHLVGGGIDFGHGEAFVVYEFCIKVRKEIDSETIRRDYVLEEALDIVRVDYGGYPILAGGYLDVTVTFGKEWLPNNKIPKNIPITISYTTTDGEEFSKEYILDFTQTPFQNTRAKFE